MARRVKDQSLDSREARSKLEARGRPYWRSIGKGLHIGYRKGQGGGAWCIRQYQGEQKYKVETVAIADDREDANGETVLDFWQAQEAARSFRPRKIGAYTVKQAIAAYIDHLGDKPSAYDAKLRLNAFALPAFGNKAVNELEAGEIRKWHRQIARLPARKRTKYGHQQAYRQHRLQRPGGCAQASDLCQSLPVLVEGCIEPRMGREEGDRCGVARRVDAGQALRGRRRCPRALSLARRVQAPAQRMRGRFPYPGTCRLTYRRALRRAGAPTCWRLQQRAATLHVRKSKANKDRHIVLTDEGRAFFAQLSAGRLASDLLLGREWKKANQSDPMKAACKRAKIEPAVGFHQLRHTWASLSAYERRPPVCDRQGSRT